MLLPVGQLQTPLTQAPLPQREPQLPQFCASVARLTQAAA